MDDAGQNLVLRSVRNYQRAIADGIQDATMPVIPQGVDETIALTDATRAWAKQHIAATVSVSVL